MAFQLFRNRGIIFHKFDLHGAMVCVWGDLKCTFKTTTVTQMLNVSRIMVNSTNLPSKGTWNKKGIH